MTEEIKRYFYGDSRKKLQENTYTDGKLTKIEKWYESGQILNKMNFLENKHHGSSISWYENGQVMEECNWLNNKLHGLYACYYKNCKKQRRFTYSEDLRHGKFETWNKRGKLTSSEDYVFNYNKKHLLIILRTLRKAKWIRLAKLTKTREFNEWWYITQIIQVVK